MKHNPDSIQDKSAQKSNATAATKTLSIPKHLGYFDNLDLEFSWVGVGNLGPAKSWVPKKMWVPKKNFWVILFFAFFIY